MENQFIIPTVALKWDFMAWNYHIIQMTLCVLWIPHVVSNTINKKLPIWNSPPTLVLFQLWTGENHYDFAGLMASLGDYIRPRTAPQRQTVLSASNSDHSSAQKLAFLGTADWTINNMHTATCVHLPEHLLESETPTYRLP